MGPSVRACMRLVSNQPPNPLQPLNTIPYLREHGAAAVAPAVGNVAATIVLPRQEHLLLLLCQQLTLPLAAAARAREGEGEQPRPGAAGAALVPPPSLLLLLLPLLLLVRGGGDDGDVAALHLPVDLD